MHCVKSVLWRGNFKTYYGIRRMFALKRVTVGEQKWWHEGENLLNSNLVEILHDRHICVRYFISFWIFGTAGHQDLLQLKCNVLRCFMQLKITVFCTTTVLILFSYLGNLKRKFFILIFCDLMEICVCLIWKYVGVY